MLENIDYKALTFWFQLAQALITGLVFIYLWLTNRQKANTASIEKMRDAFNRDLNKLDDRMIRVEKDIEHLPTHDDMAKLHTRVNETAQRLTAVEGELKQINNTLHLMHKHLLSGGNR